MFDLYIFDFDGTIADSRLSITKSMNYAFKEFGFAEIDASLIHPFIGKLMITDTFRQFYELSPEELTSLVAAFRHHQRVHVKRDLSYFPEVRESLESLKANGKSLAILSNKAQHALEDALVAFDYLPLFDMVLGSGKLKEAKPHRSCVEHIWHNIPKNAEQTVMIGDSEVDVQTAKNAGIKMIAVGHGTDSAESLLSMGADYAIKNFSEILNL